MYGDVPWELSKQSLGCHVREKRKAEVRNMDAVLMHLTTARSFTPLQVLRDECSPSKQFESNLAALNQGHVPNRVKRQKTLTPF